MKSIDNEAVFARVAHRTHAVAFAALLLTLVSTATLAQTSLSLSIARTTSNTGTTLLRLLGVGGTGTCIYPDASSVVVGTGSITIITAYHTSPCFGISPPQQFDLTVDVGVLPIGHYVVNWYFGSPSTIVAASTSLDVTNLGAALTVPASGMFTLMMSALALFGSGALALRPAWRA